MPAWEAVQLTLGLLVPPLLVWHVVGTRLAHELAGTRGHLHARGAASSGSSNPVAGLRQVVVLVVAWIHGCTGLHFWLRLRPWYPRFARTIYSGFLLLPVLALLGFAAAGREVARLAREPGFVQATIREAQLPDPAQRAVLGRVARTHLLGRPGRDRAGAGGARDARAHPAPARRAGRLSGRPGGARPARLHGARGEPLRGHPARLGLRRARPLLDVSRAGDPRRGASPGRDRRRAARARARGRARARAAGLPGPPAPRSRGGAARAGRRRPARRGGRGGSRRSPRRRGADDRGALRRPARVHPPGRAEAPVRRGLHPEPLLRGGRRRDHGCGRHRQPVHRRRRHGALRRGRRRTRGGLAARRSARRPRWSPACRS